MTSNPAFTGRNIQKANASLLYSGQEQKSLVTYHTLQSLCVCVWLVNTLTSTVPIGSPIICMWSPADICEQWERNLSFGSADVRGAGTRDEPLRTSAWEATDFQKPNPKYLRAAFFLTMTITPHHYKRPFSKSKKVKREYINGNHLPTRINDILCKQPTKSVRHILLPANFSARGLRLLRATRLIHNSFESILGRLRLL